MLVIFYTELSQNMSPLITGWIGELPGWIISFPIDHANSTWPERKKDQFKAMIDKLQKVKRWLGVETSLQEKLPGGALFIFPLLIFLERAVPNWCECLWSAGPHQP